jgi:hypothetical protein
VLLSEEKFDWDLTLTALHAEDQQRAVRFLTGAILACGGWVLSRSIRGSDSAEITFEFARALSLEIYSLLIAAGLELSRDAHVSMTELCQCTKALISTCAYDVARIRLIVLQKPPDCEHKKDENVQAQDLPDGQ